MDARLVSCWSLAGPPRRATWETLNLHSLGPWPWRLMERYWHGNGQREREREIKWRCDTLNSYPYSFGWPSRCFCLSVWLAEIEVVVRLLTGLLVQTDATNARQLSVVVAAVFFGGGGGKVGESKETNSIVVQDESSRKLTLLPSPIFNSTASESKIHHRRTKRTGTDK